MIIDFTRNRAKTPYINFGVQGNNLVDELIFLIETKQESVDLAEYTPKLKVVAKNNRYAELTSNLVVEQVLSTQQNARLKITYKIPDDVTRQGKVDLQLVFEKSDGGTDETLVWQTQIITITFDRDIDISQAVNIAYPDIIKDLSERTQAAELASQNAVAVANSANEKSNQTSALASSVVLAENQRQQNEIERQQAEQNRVAAWANAEGIKQIAITDTATDKKYGYQIKLVDGKPQLIYEEI